MLSTFPPSYHPISQEDGEHQNHSKILQSFHKRPKILCYIIPGILITTFSLLLSVLIILHRRQPSWTSCGDNQVSALHRGCSFDLISFAWQTPECYDSSLVSEFANWDTWSFFTEPNGTITVPTDVILRGQQSAWVSWRYHTVHCTFMWRQMHRAYERGWIDAHLRAYNHTLHCQNILLMEGVDNEAIFTNATVIYPTCEPAKQTLETRWWNSIYSK